MPAAGSADLTVVVKGGKNAIDATREVYGAGDVRIIELTPKKKLAAHAHYVVSVLAPGAKDAWVGEFTTGDKEATAAPDRPDVRVVEPDRKAPQTDCASGDPWLTLAVAAPGKPVRYAVWIGDAQGKIDYGAQPAALLSEANGKLLIGHPSVCLPANVDKWPPGRPPRLGIKAVDLAGNQSEAVEVGR